MWSAKKATAFLFAALFLLSGVALAQDDGGFDDGFGDDLGEPRPPVRASSEPADISRELELLRTSHVQLQQYYKEAQGNEHKATPSATASAPPAAKKLEEKLAAQRDFDFDDITLNELSEWLNDKLDVNVRIDRRALEDENIEPSIDRFSFHVRALTFRRALENLLHNQNLAFTANENGIVISSEPKLDETLYANVYPVLDLVRSPLSDEEEVADYDTLIDCITTFVEPDSWDEVGGPATISMYKGTLCVSTTRECHESIAQLLAGLRSEPALVPTDNKRKFVATALSDGPNASEFRKKLDQVVDLKFTEQRLVDVLEKLQSRHDIPMLIDTPALADEIMDGGEILSVDIQGATLSNGLRQMLADLDLTYVTHGEVVHVTTKTKAEETLQVRIYACGQFIENIDPSSDLPAMKELQRLAEILMNDIEPDSWNFVGGPGAIRVFPKRGLLVVSNTEDVHRQVHKHLTTLLKTRSTNNVAPAKPYAVSDVVVKVYPLADSLPDNDARYEIVHFFENQLENTDNAVNSRNSSFSMTLVGKSLVVSHRRDAQRTIQSVLQKLSVLDMPAIATENVEHAGGGMMGSGMGGGMF